MQNLQINILGEGKIYIKKQFERYLISKGYSQTTPSGNPSTVYDYIKRIDKICKFEHKYIISEVVLMKRLLSYDFEFVQDLNPILDNYGKIKEFFEHLLRVK